MGQSQSIVGACKSKNIPIGRNDYEIQFESSHVVKFGNITKGGLEAEPDIAGKGVSRLNSNEED